MKSSKLDRWLSGSVTEAIVKSASVPVLVIPPDWKRPFGCDWAPPSGVAPDESSSGRYVSEWPQPLLPERPARILVALDGSRSAEQAFVPTVRLAQFTPSNLILLRVIHDGDRELEGATEYIGDIAAKVQPMVPGLHIVPRIMTGHAADAILDVARECDIDAIAMATRGLTGPTRAVLGSTAIHVLGKSSVPLLLVGPQPVHLPVTENIQLRARVRTLHNRVVGEVHRAVVDLEQMAMVSVVVLGRGPQSRDVLVPLDFIDVLDGDEIELRLTKDELDQLPDFSYNDFVTAPPEAWTSFLAVPNGPILVPISQRKRLAPSQHDVTPGTCVKAEDGEIGTVNRLEVDRTGRLLAFWVHAGRVFATDRRIPAEWIRHTDSDGNLLVAGVRADIEAYLGAQSGERLRPRPPAPAG